MSVCKSCQQLHLTWSTIYDVQTFTFMCIQIVVMSAHQASRHDARQTFASMLDKIDNEDSFLKSVCFCNVAAFHLKGLVNRLNCGVWGSELPHKIFEHQRDTPKVNVWCGMVKDCNTGTFFFLEATVTSHSYQALLEQYAVPQLPNDAWLQRDGIPPHFGCIVHKFLDVLDKSVPWHGLQGHQT
jgi:hypothetical protein